jgi:SAM-dependent methyltransferase
VTQLPDWAPPDLDMTRPSAARVYDYFLGGAHNFEVDRQLAEQVARITPNVGETMRANRAFLRRAVTFLVEQGIRQFLDIGSGIPTVGNVHEVAQAAAPDARVVYVDIDPVAVAHSRSILRGNDNAAVLCADLRDPHGVLAEVHRLGLLDFDRPIAVLLAGILHFIPDSDNPAKLVEPLREALAPGSYVIISHATADGQPPELVESQKLSRRTSTEIRLRPKAEVEPYFEGLTLVEPGLVHISFWRHETDEEPEKHPERAAAYAGVGRKD